MADLLRNTTIAVRTDPLAAPTPQTVAPWPDVLAFLHHLETLVKEGKSFHLVETPSQVTCVVADVPVAQTKVAPSAPPKAAPSASRPRRAATKA